ncbi:hypothetical protein GM418_10140 [Maribellus comscasis]|uniref:Signal transduction histidine kinase internal region domain-containing protein n=1 Tax=Maribellus comscasis TaxID=2681766 RepID=A0A6I6JV36_9BACT|nr:histidine kinase [Maribellus comscasis]QGY44002.1 hypothetical protein GM418_10140 [Maribellus comscasis]
MKTKLFLTLTIIFNFARAFSQEQIIKLNLQERHEYIFEKIDKIYLKSENEPDKFLQEDAKKIKITVEKIVPNELIEFSFQYSKNIRDNGSYGEMLNCVDYFFPELVVTRPYDVVQGLLCRSVLKFSLNLKTNSIELINRQNLINSFRTRLAELQIEGEELDLVWDIINKNKWFIEDEEVRFLTWFNNSNLTDKSIINSKIPDKLKVIEKSPTFISLGDENTQKIVPGKTQKKYWLNLESGIITNYSSIRYESSKGKTEKNFLTGNWKVFEKSLSLIDSHLVPAQKLFVSGKIEDPLSNKIFIKFLDQPFGTILKEITVFLNENGSFSTSFNFHNSGLIYIENENPNRNLSNEKIVMYGEPGDSLKFIANGKEKPWTLSFYGERKNEAELLLELREKIKLENLGLISPNSSQYVLDGDLYFGRGATKMPDGTYKINYKNYNTEFEKAIKQTDDISFQYKNTVNKEVRSFIANEVKAFIYNGVYDYLISSIFLERRYPGHYVTDAENKNTKRISALAEELNPQLTYNDYGIQSRKSISKYLNYQLRKTKKVSSHSSTVISRFYSFNDIDQLTQFAQLILTGAPLYREIGSTFNQILMDYLPIRNMPHISYSNNEKEAAIQYLQLMARSCNDIELVNEINQKLQQRAKIETGDHIPNLKLFDSDGKEQSFSDLIKGKPTVFYFPSTWIGDRYELDVIAPKNPDLEIIMVTEGSNFREWKEYNKRAEPVIQQLFYKNDTASLKELLFHRSTYAAFDREGNFLGYHNSFKSASDAAKTSVEKKQLDKSQLKIIIIVLLILLTLLILSLLIWRWRVRQRFRKEQQQRRLRELELTAIRSQMNPHFLFNSLNSVQNLVQQNKGREAHLYLADFAGLIRKVLQNSEKEEVSLAEELEMINQYLNLEKLRFDFDFTISVEDKIDTNNTMVPSMLLQPFAENAVIHGLQNKTGYRQLKIEVARDKSGIKITIEDNGVGREAAKNIAKAKNGKGSKLMKDRLEILQEKHGEKYHLETIDLTENDTGTRVDIYIPEEN